MKSRNIAFASCLSVKEPMCSKSHQALVYPVYNQDGTIDLTHLGGINLYGETEWYDLETPIEFKPAHVSDELKDYFLRCYHHLEHLNWFSPYQLAKTIRIIESEDFLTSDLKEMFIQSCRKFQIFPIHTGKPWVASFIWNDYVVTPSFLFTHSLKKSIRLEFRYTCPIEETVIPNQYDFLVLESTKNGYLVREITDKTKQYQSILSHYQKKIIDLSPLDNLPFVRLTKDCSQLISNDHYPLLFEHLIEMELSLIEFHPKALLNQFCQFWKTCTKLTNC